MSEFERPQQEAPPAQEQKAAPPPAEEAPPVAPEMSDTQKAQIAEIREKVADAQNLVRAYAQNKPVTPEQKYEFGQAQDQVVAAWNKIHQIREQSGKRRELVIIGSGAGGTQLATFDGYEGGDPVMVSPGHSQAYHSREIVNVGAKREGITGKEFFGEKEMSAKIAGAQNIPGEVVDLKYANGKDGSDGVDVYVGVRSGKGPKDYKVTQVIPAWDVAIATGSQQVIVPYPGYKATGWGSSDEFIMNARGGNGLVYGRGNAATQGILSALGEKDPKTGKFVIPKVISLSRSDFFKNSEASDDQLQRLKSYERQGRVQFVTGVLDAPGGVTKNADGTLTVKVAPSKANPNADYTFNVKAVENFLLSKNNTAWATHIPELETTPVLREDRSGKLVPDTDFKTGQPVPPFIKVIAPGSHRTTMENVYALGDIRETLPGETRGRRIKTAEGDAADVAVDVQERTALRRNHEPLDPWTTQKPEGAPIDQRLKSILKQTTPEDTPHGGSLYEAPTRFFDMGTTRAGTKKTLKGQDVYVSSETGEPALTGGKVGKPAPTSIKPKTKEDIGPPPAPVGQQQQQQQGVEEVAAGGAVRPGPGLPAESVEPRPESRAQAKPPAGAGMIAKPDYGPRAVDTPGMIERGNIDYNDRPQFYNDDGTTARRSVPIQNERGHVLIPTLDEGGNPLSVPQAIARYQGTGEHLGVFRDAGSANDFAASYDRGPVMSPEQVNATSNARVAANRYYPDRLVNELNSGNRSVLGPVEEKTLVDHLDRLQTERDTAGRAAMDDKIPIGDRAGAVADFEAADARIRELDNATDSGNALRGRKNQLLWHQYRAKDYELPGMEQKLAVAKGGVPPTPVESAALKRMVDTP